ncbi:MAG: HlyD family secretion protein [Alistipes sp.]
MKQKIRRRLQNSAVILLLAIGFAWIAYKFVGFTSSTYTDNAQVYQRLVPVNSRVQGFVKEVCFDDYVRVRKGDTLLIVEDADFRLRLAQARANLQNASSGKNAAVMAASTSTNNITVTDAALAEVEALLANAKRDFDRYAVLLRQEAVTQQQYDVVETNYLALKAKRDMLLRQKGSTGMIAQQQSHRVGQNEAEIEVAKAAVDLAELNLSYTIITAPCDGYTSRRNIQPGQLLQPGQTVVFVVDTENTWVIANYKETQTARMNVGDTVRIKVDAVPDVRYSGIIETISNATGAKYSPIPQDNSTGNFVKVEQRIPVKIRFCGDTSQQDIERLRAGMNVECKVVRR